LKGKKKRNGMIAEPRLFKCAKYRLANCYYYRKGKKQNFKKVIRWYVESAELESKYMIFHYYKNGSSTSVSHMTIETDIQILLTYLNTKYDAFELNEVEDEIDTIHNELYSLSFNEWTENWTTESTSIDPLTGETTTTTHHHSREHLDTELDTESFESYMNDNIDDLLDENQKEKYESLLEIGGMTLRQELGSPFINDEWENNITSGFGWRVHPIDENKDFHRALDIAFPIGTPINAVMGGTVTNIGNNSSYGKYIVIEIGNTKTLYAHCSSIEKNINDQIIKGDIIARVGNTGTSTGSHLHLEYIKDGIYLPPDYYLSKN
jgi:formamidopyrimidine-DNA glycosylase